jgi:pimeloyl-ACP methyl ester carboxylesterase
MISRREALIAGLSMTGLALAPRRAGANEFVRAVDGRIRLPDGRTLGYAECGDPAGPLVFYFHGTPGSRLEATLIAEEAAAAGVRLVSLGRPGMGLSTYQSNRRITNWPADVACAAEALGYSGTSFGILAMSGGAPYALACVRAMPDRLTHVAIASGHTPPNAPGVTPGNQDKLIAFVVRRPRLATTGFNVVIRRLHRKPDAVARKIAESWSAADRQLVFCDPALYRALIANLNEASRCGPAGIVTDVQLLGSCWPFRLCDLPPASISIWQGGCDPIAPPSMGHYFHRQLAGSELVIDPKAGHVTLLKWHAPEILARFAAPVSSL